jgi:hypothetical protein
VLEVIAILQGREGDLARAFVWTELIEYLRPKFLEDLWVTYKKVKHPAKETRGGVTPGEEDIQ